MTVSDLTITFNDHGLGKRMSEPAVKQAVEAALNKAVMLVAERGSQYPSPPPGSTYRRTGTLGRSIAGRVESLSGEVRGLVGTKVSYAPFVIGEKQSSVHSGRWATLIEVAQDNLDQINQFMEQAAQEVAEKVEG